MKIAIGNDHAGPQYKFAIVAYLKSQGYQVINFGTDTEDSVDYPDYIHPVANAVSSKEADLGVILCGSGNGAAMTANKHQDIRCALCWNKEMAELAKLHNNANIISIPARFTSQWQAVEITKTFLNTQFEGGRHLNRINKIPCK
jgi:ribose 5-phosphate isomerase B